MKSAVKTKARKTNNQASFGQSLGLSLLKNNIEVEAAMEMGRHLDETGLHQVYTVYTWVRIRFGHSSKMVCPSILFTPDLHKIYTRFALFTLNLLLDHLRTVFFPGNFPPFWNM